LILLRIVSRIPITHNNVSCFRQEHRVHARSLIFCVCDLELFAIRLTVSVHVANGSCRNRQAPASQGA
jgi:hypothetical protein